MLSSNLVVFLSGLLQSGGNRPSRSSSSPSSAVPFAAAAKELLCFCRRRKDDLYLDECPVRVVVKGNEWGGGFARETGGHRNGALPSLCRTERSDFGTGFFYVGMGIRESTFVCKLYFKY